MKSAELIAQARRLARATKRPSRQVDLRRAVSDAYYAMFHELAKECADSVIGQQAKSKQPEAWVQVYRALDHGAARNGCEQVRQKSFASEITLFASDFVNQQRHRHDADYNPVAVYTQKEVATMIDEAQKAIASLRSATTADRRAFVALVLFPTKRRR